MSDDCQKPKYTHDCDACIFLGRYKKLDLYACKGGSLGSFTLLGRYGDDGPEYSSYSAFGADVELIKKFSDWYIVALYLYAKLLSSKGV